MNLKFFSAIFLVALAGCANNVKFPGTHEIQFIPEKGGTQVINNGRITYILPKSAEPSQGINGLIFPCRTWGEDTKREKIIANFSDNILNVERRTDNGMAGSGKKYVVEVSKEVEASNILITFKPKTVSTYQDGVILPFPLPAFDIESYLTTAYYDYDLELTSPYSVDSVKGNFDRILGGGREYEMELANANIVFKLQIYPYRNGSKVMIKAQIHNMKKLADVVNVNNIINEFKGRLAKIIYD